MEDVAAFGELVDVADVGVGEDGLGDTAARFRGEEDDVVGDKRSAAAYLLSVPLIPRLSRFVEYILESPLTLPTTRTLIHPHQLNPIPRLTPIHQIIPQNHLHAPRQLPRRRPFRHLLNIDGLKVLESGETILHRDGVAVAVVAGDDGRRGGGGVEGLGGDGGGVVVVSGVEAVGGLAVVDGLQHLWSDQRAYSADVLSLERWGLS